MINEQSKYDKIGVNQALYYPAEMAGMLMVIPKQ